METKRQPLAARVINKIKREGLLKVFLVCVSLFYAKIKSIYKSCFAKICTITAKSSSKADKNKNCLYAFYDLEKSPLTYDVIVFAIRAEIVAKNLGIDSFHVVIVPAKKGTFGENPTRGYDEKTLWWRLHNLVVPCCGLLPSCSGTTVCESRQEAENIHKNLAEHIYPSSYTVAFPVKDHTMKKLVEDAEDNGTDIKLLQAPESAKDYVQKWIDANAKGKKIVTITIRNSFFHEQRNSNIDAWINFAKSLDKKEFFPVFIPDTETYFEKDNKKFKDVTVFAEAAWNLFIRVALNELAYMNMGINNGPTMLNVFNKNVSYIYIKVVTEDCPATNTNRMYDFGYNVGGNFSFALPDQHVIWKEDTEENIKEAFEMAANEKGD